MKSPEAFCNPVIPSLSYDGYEKSATLFFANHEHYCSISRYSLYLSKKAKPYLIVSANMLASNVEKHPQMHMLAAKRVLHLKERSHGSGGDNMPR